MIKLQAFAGHVMAADPPGPVVARRAGVTKQSAQSKVQVAAGPEEVSADISDNQMCGTWI